MNVNSCAAGIYYSHGFSFRRRRGGCFSELILSHAFFPRGTVAPEGDCNGGFEKQPWTDCHSGSWPLWYNVLRLTAPPLSSLPLARIFILAGEFLPHDATVTTFATPRNFGQMLPSARFELQIDPIHPI
jgi:hypothetical protein